MQALVRILRVFAAHNYSALLHLKQEDESDEDGILRRADTIATALILENSHRMMILLYVKVQMQQSHYGIILIVFFRIILDF